MLTVSKIKAIAEELALPLAEKLGVELYDVDYKKEGSDWRLTYYIDKPGGVSLVDCEEFSRQISEMLDQTDPIEQNYILTVSSPGIERKLTKPAHFQAALGKKIEVKLFTPKEGKKQFVGLLKAFEENKVVLDCDGTEVTITLDEISAAKLVYEF